ncbi:hypothetical protein [Colwellia sp. RSH04]|uniref:hypothetical protein n=1 Tax=Colwellia sp. RSH04 TaxID=2305464 RepID=UPI000E5691DB|nr:hypothetical protein [Colwellia sp. RSH04]RHW76910.1 hypothetical protein D1094_07475 [Colwellia sp. RSH04]
MIDKVEKREKSLTEFIITVVLLALLMKVFISYYFDQQEQITTTGFNRLAQSFNSTVIAVHAQWLMENKPSVVTLKQLNSEAKQRFSVNKNGWLDITKNNFSCEKIWQAAVAVPMSLMKLSIATIELKEQGKNFHHCRYILPSGQFFDYHSETGKVTEVIPKSK